MGLCKNCSITTISKINIAYDYPMFLCEKCIQQYQENQLKMKEKILKSQHF